MTKTGEEFGSGKEKGVGIPLDRKTIRLVIRFKRKTIWSEFWLTRKKKGARAD